MTKYTYDFQYSYISKFIDEKEYSKYLKFAKISIQPKYLIAPYFMIRYSSEALSWIKINAKLLDSFLTLKNEVDIAAELIMDKNVLQNPLLINEIINSYTKEGYDYIFIWIDDFNFFKDNSSKYFEGFKKLINGFNALEKKVVNLYGGFGWILLCHHESKYKLYGVAQSTGYGESRPITPVGGGLPINKYYFLPLHERLKMQEAIDILIKQGYMENGKSNSKNAEEYYKNVCDCKQCREVIKDNIENFEQYNHSNPFVTKNNIK
ncbi:hypothetical protein [Spiroplasma endosymbiont of Nebria brevicollis]|uniref:hypothetical protein n=1 Tax=Spiroplasma endosymbiont of Nebria brevicollis TaxID=3066284 RepID=UPI00313ACDCC